MPLAHPKLFTHAGIVSSESSSTPSTSLLHSVHWFSVKYRIKYKIACLTFKDIHLQTSHYLQSLISCYQSPRNLCSQDRNLFTPSPTRTLL